MSASMHLVNEVVPLLVDEVNAELAKHSRNHVIANGKVEYFDTHAPECYFTVGLLSQQDREKFLAFNGPSAISDIWRASTVSFEIGVNAKSRAYHLLKKVYEYMSDEDETLSRIVAQQLCIAINSRELPSVVRVTDDFVVYPQNGTDVGCDEYKDICATIPTKRLALLRERKLIGDGEFNWRDRTDFPTRRDFLEFIDRIIQPMSENQKLAYWIDRLRNVLAGRDFEFRVFGFDSAYIMKERLQNVNSTSALLLLNLAAKLVNRVEEWKKGTVAAHVIRDRVCEILAIARQHVRPTEEVKILLCIMLSKTAEIREVDFVNASCCETLHALYQDFPKPVSPGGYDDQRPLNLKEILAHAKSST